MTDGLGPLHVAVLDRFIPQFAPRAKVLFLRGNEDRPRIFMPGTMQHLGIPCAKINKLPDVVLHLPSRRLLILVALNVLIGVKQRNQIERLLSECSARREYVSALSNRQAYHRAGNNVAWNTHVWLAEVPDHMIHCNGDKFLGPSRRRK